jgi:hypothetical protein
MPDYSPELSASVLHQYVHTDKPIAQIAADHRINARDVTRIRHAAGCPPRGARVRVLPPAMRELHRAATRLQAEAADVGRNTRGEAEHIAPREAERIAPNDADGAMRCAYCALRPENECGLPALIARVQRLVERELAAEEATRAALGSLARTPTEAERCARTVASMTRTLQVLLRLRAGLSSEQGSSNVDDYPADIDAFRDEFARRIRAFVASRTDAGRVA